MPNLVRIGPTVWISIPDTHTHTQEFNFIYKTSWGYPALPGSLFTNNKVYCVGKGGKVCEPQNMLGWIGISAIFTS